MDKQQRQKFSPEVRGSYSWEKGTYIGQGGWATFPGSSEPNSAVAQACAEMLSKAAR